MEPRIQYARTSDGVSIAYGDAGNGPPILWFNPPGFCHVQLDWEVYSIITQALARKHRFVWFDWPGTGLSQRDRYNFSLDSLHATADAVIARAGLQTFTLCAATGGVAPAVSFAARNADRVGRLVLADGWTKYGDFADSPAWQAEKALREKDWTVYSETITRILWGFDDENLAKQMAHYLRSCVEQDVYQAAVAAWEAWDVESLLSEIQCPTLVVHNRRNPAVPLSVGQRIAAAISGARFLVIDDLSWASLAPIIDDFIGDQIIPRADDVPDNQATFRTVLFTDVVGHTEMMQRLGDERGRAVLREHERITRELLKAHGGAEIKTDGDSFMVSFSSVTKAAECAVALQKAFTARNETAAEPLRIRVGLNAGEPLAEDGDLFGSTVILAARLAAQAGPSEILVPEPVRHLLTGKDFLFSDRGDVVLKGFEDAVRVYEVRWRE